jgi:hypothetical protein
MCGAWKCSPPPGIRPHIHVLAPSEKRGGGTPPLDRLTVRIRGSILDQDEGGATSHQQQQQQPPPPATTYLRSSWERGRYARIPGWYRQWPGLRTSLPFEAPPTNPVRSHSAVYCQNPDASQERHTAHGTRHTVKWHLVLPDPLSGKLGGLRSFLCDRMPHGTRHTRHTCEPLLGGFPSNGRMEQDGNRFRRAVERRGQRDPNLSGDGLPIEVAQLGQFVGDEFPEGRER